MKVSVAHLLVVAAMAPLFSFTAMADVAPMTPVPAQVTTSTQPLMSSNDVSPELARRGWCFHHHWDRRCRWGRR